MKRRHLLASAALMLSVAGAGIALAGWKLVAVQSADAAAAAQPEPMELVTAATAEAREHRHRTTSIGTVLALQSITLRNELAGTVREAHLMPGAVVEAGTLLVQLDVSVEEAELRAAESQTRLAELVLERMHDAVHRDGVSDIELQRATAERDIARAGVERIRAVIARKTIVAPFRARVGMSDLHPGQYLEEGTVLTTLQGVDTSAHVDFSVPQQVAAALSVGDVVDILRSATSDPLKGMVTAIDARVDPSTRNAVIRARVDDAGGVLSPGSSVRVDVRVGAALAAVAVPVSSVRKGPEGDHVFVLVDDEHGQTRARVRPIRSGTMLGDEIIVLDGLRAGERVAASGSFKLREGVLTMIAGRAGEPTTAAHQ